jgi:hypothetical protein
MTGEMPNSEFSGRGLLRVAKRRRYREERRGRRRWKNLLREVLVDDVMDQIGSGV